MLTSVGLHNPEARDEERVDCGSLDYLAWEMAENKPHAYIQLIIGLWVSFCMSSCMLSLPTLESESQADTIER